MKKLLFLVVGFIFLFVSVSFVSAATLSNTCETGTCVRGTGVTAIGTVTPNSVYDIFVRRSSDGVIVWDPWGGTTADKTGVFYHRFSTSYWFSDWPAGEYIIYVKDEYGSNLAQSSFYLNNYPLPKPKPKLYVEQK